MSVRTSWLSYKQYLSSRNNVNSEYCLTKLHTCLEDICGAGREMEKELNFYFV